MAELRIRERHDLLTTNRAAKMLSQTRMTVFRRIRNGSLGAEQIGRQLFVYRIEIEQLARERLTVPAVNA